MDIDKLIDICEYDEENHQWNFEVYCKKSIFDPRNNRHIIEKGKKYNGYFTLKSFGEEFYIRDDYNMAFYDDNESFKFTWQLARKKRVDFYEHFETKGEQRKRKIRNALEPEKKTFLTKIKTFFK